MVTGEPGKAPASKARLVAAAVILPSLVAPTLTQTLLPEGYDVPSELTPMAQLDCIPMLNQKPEATPRPRWGPLSGVW